MSLSEKRIWNNGNTCGIIETESKSTVAINDIIKSDKVHISACCSEGASFNADNLDNLDALLRFLVTRDRNPDTIGFPFFKEVLTGNAYSGKNEVSYQTDEGDEVILTNRSYSKEEIDKILLDLSWASYFDYKDYDFIFSQLRFKNLYLCPLLNSGDEVVPLECFPNVALNLRGYAWVEYTSEEEKKALIEELEKVVAIYSDWESGKLNVFSVNIFSKENDTWTLFDNYTTIDYSIDKVWESIEGITDEVDDFNKSDYDFVRSQITITNDDVFNYLLKTI